MAMLMSVMSFAQVVTFSPANETAVESQTFTLTSGDVTLVCSSGTITADQFRFFKNQTVTISSTGGNIVSVEFTCTASNGAKYGPGCFTTTSGDYTYAGKVGTWTGEANEVKFTASSNQVRATQVVVTLLAAGGVPQPSIQGATDFIESAEVSIVASEGLKVYYTLDGTDPTTESTEYTAPFTVEETTTVKAIAHDGTNASDVTETTFTKATKVTCAEAAEIASQLSGNNVLSDLYYVVVGYVTELDGTISNGQQKFWVSDTKGGANTLYSYWCNVPQELVVGDYIQMFGKLTKYYEKNQMKNGDVTILEEPTPEPVKYTVTVTAENGTVEGAGEYEEGTEITLTATPNEGYEFVNWTENEVEVSTDAEYTFEVLADRALVANFKEAEPVYQVIEDEITNFVFDTESWPMVCSGGPSANYQIEVFLVLTEAADGTLSYEDCSVSINGTDATFIEGTLFDLDVYAPSADAVLRVQWNGEFYELHLAMSAAAAEPIVVVVENATLDDKVESTGFFYMAGECTIDGVIYPVKAEIPGFDKTKAEAEYENVMVEVGTWGGEYLGNATGTATVSVVDNVVTLSGVIENPMTHVAFDVTISGTLPVVEPTTITWELNGGEVLAAVPTNAELWEAFKPYYNTYYGLERADQPITAVASFASAKMQEIMTDPESEYKWLGDYVLSVAAEQGVTVDSELTWRFSVHTFFNAEKRTAYPSNVPDFTEAGKPENWGPAYQAAHEVVLPTEPVAEDYVLPTPVKEGYTFVGWYDNADGEGEAMTVLPAGWAGTLYAIWEVEGPATALENIAVEGKAVKAIVNGQLIIIKNGVQYNAQGQVVK